MTCSTHLLPNGAFLLQDETSISYAEVQARFFQHLFMKAGPCKCSECAGNETEPPDKQIKLKYLPVEFMIKLRREFER